MELESRATLLVNGPTYHLKVQQGCEANMLYPQNPLSGVTCSIGYSSIKKIQEAGGIVNLLFSPKQAAPASLQV